MLRACLFCLPAASVVDPQLGGPIGGTETRAWLFARMLARRNDMAVTFVVRHRRPMSTTVQDVTIHTVIDRVFNLFEQVGLCVARRNSFPWLRLRQWRWRLLWQLPAAVALRVFSPAADPTRPAARFHQLQGDVFCTFGVQTTSATVIASAHASGRPAVLVLGSDGDLDPQFLTDPDYINPYGDRASVCRFILEHADAIVCQTTEQQGILKERFGRDGVVIANPIDLETWDRRAGAITREGEAPAEPPPGVALPSAEDFALASVAESLAGSKTSIDRSGNARGSAGASPSPTTSPNRPVLWVGRAEAIHKRPMLCVEIAKRCPEISFVMVMNPRDPAEEVRVRTAAPPNVTIRDFVSPSDMPALMRSSLALLNTSSLEGFPNTFLQAGAARIPVVSLVVGNEFLAASGGGTCCDGDLDRAASSIRRYAADATDRTGAGERGRRWVEEHHDAAARTAEFRDELVRVKTSFDSQKSRPRQ